MPLYGFLIENVPSYFRRPEFGLGERDLLSYYVEDLNSYLRQNTKWKWTGIFSCLPLEHAQTLGPHPPKGTKYQYMVAITDNIRDYESTNLTMEKVGEFSKICELENVPATWYYHPNDKKEFVTCLGQDYFDNSINNFEDE